uniref:Uncharacterized protein n=1 Tax=Arundo donax TaxID=35708 RepID=A0A0A9DKX0_ARUDO
MDLSTLMPQACESLPGWTGSSEDGSSAAFLRLCRL